MIDIKGINSKRWFKQELNDFEMTHFDVTNFLIDA